MPKPVKYCCNACGERYNTVPGQVLKCPVCGSKDREELSDVYRREKLAAFMHDTWSHWTEHMLLKLCYGSRDNLHDPVKRKPRLNGDDWAGEARQYIDRWNRQRVTSYNDLTEEEKQSDRELADKLLKILEE
jgi:hypothetical protein